MLPAVAAGLFNMGVGGLQYISDRQTNIENRHMQDDTNDANLRMTRETNAMNSSIAQENRDWEEKMWREQTEYNSPAAMMKRYEEAGINPNMVVGSVAESRMANAPTPEIPHMEAARFDAAHNQAPRLNVDNPIAMYQQIKNEQALNALQNKKLDQVKAEASSAESKAKYDVWKYDFMKEHGMVDANPVNALLNKGWELSDTTGKWIGTKAADATRFFETLDMAPARR